MVQIEVAYLRRLNRLGIVPFALLLLICIPSLAQITLDLMPKPDVTDGVYFQNLKRFKAGLVPDDYILVAVPAGNQPADGFMVVNQLSDRFVELPLVESVVSIATVEDGGVQKTEIEKYFMENPLMKQLLQSPDGQMLSILVFPVRNANPTEFAASIVESVPDKTDLIIQGAPMYEYYGEKGIVRDYALLLPVAMIIVLLMECFITRSFRIGFSLWVSAVFAMVVTLSLFPLARVDLRIESLMVPIEVIILSTSYGIHLHREWSLHEHMNLADALSRISGVILVAALTTTLGFATLLLSKLAIIRELGLFLMAGILVAYISSVFLLPSLFSLLKVEPRGKPKNDRILVADRRKIGVVVTTAAILILSLGCFRLYLDPRFITVFRRESKVVSDYRRFKEHYIASDEIEVFIDTGVEYGLVDVQLNNTLREFTRRVEREEYVDSSRSFLDFIDWIRGSELFGTAERPSSVEQIGEALELLASADVGLRLFSYIDIAYSRARLVYRVGSPGQSSREFSKILLRIEKLIQREASEFPAGVSYTLGGLAYEQLELARAIIGGQMRGILAFLCMIPILLLVILKKVRLVLVAMIPPIVALLTFHGAMGVMRISVNIVTSVTIAALLGVSVDDVILLLMSYVRHQRTGPRLLSIDEIRSRTGAAIIQTTVTIDIGITVLFFSYYRHLAETALLSIIGLSMATLATLFIVPQFVTLIDRKSKREI